MNMSGVSQVQLRQSWYFIQEHNDGDKLKDLGKSWKTQQIPPLHPHKYGIFVVNILQYASTGKN